MPRTRPPYPQKFRDRIVELARNGRTPSELADEFEPTETTIRNWLKQADRDEGKSAEGLSTDEREELREAIESVGGKMVEKNGPEVDYVVLRNRPETEAEAAAGPDIISVAELGDLIGSTSTTWVGFPAHHIGADVLAQRYKRDARIYANVWHALREGEDRVILMFGQAHIWNLRKLFRDNPEFEVVPSEKVL